MSEYHQSVQDYIRESVNSLAKRPKSWRKCLVVVDFPATASRDDAIRVTM
jgi:hypothetical protein